MDCQEGCVVLFFWCESKFNGSIGLVTGREVVSNTQGVPPLSLRDIGNHTPPKSNDCHLKRDHVNRKIVFQPAFSGDMLEYSFTAYCVIFHKLPMYFMYKAICRGKKTPFTTGIGADLDLDVYQQKHGFLWQEWHAFEFWSHTYKRVSGAATSLRNRGLMGGPWGKPVKNSAGYFWQLVMLGWGRVGWLVKKKKTYLLWRKKAFCPFSKPGIFTAWLVLRT